MSKLPMHARAAFSKITVGSKEPVHTMRPHANNTTYCERCKTYKPRDVPKPKKGWVCLDCR